MPEPVAAAAQQPPAAAAPAATPAPAVVAVPAVAVVEPAKPAVAEPVKPAEAAVVAPKAPAKYALVVKAGDDVIVNADVLTHYEQVARASDWSNEDAQAAIDEYVLGVKAASARFLAQTAADPDYGGTSLAQTQQRMDLAINRLRPIGHPRRESFLRFMQSAGVTNHIEVMSLFSDLGKLMSEDGGTGGVSGGRVEVDPIAKMYDNTPAQT